MSYVFLLLLDGFTVSPCNYELYIYDTFDLLLKHYRKKHKFGLIEVAQIFRLTGLNEKKIGWILIEEEGEYKKFNWEPEAVWPYFHENISILEEVFDLKKSKFIDYWSFKKSVFRKNGYEILLTFPQIPQHFISKLMDRALGTPAAERPLAQKCLEKIPAVEDMIIPALSNNKKRNKGSCR